jgi:hypothetical protein
MPAGKGGRGFFKIKKIMTKKGIIKGVVYPSIALIVGGAMLHHYTSLFERNQGRPEVNSNTPDTIVVINKFDDTKTAVSTESSSPSAVHKPKPAPKPNTVIIDKPQEPAVHKPQSAPKPNSVITGEGRVWDVFSKDEAQTKAYERAMKDIMSKVPEDRANIVKRYAYKVIDSAEQTNLGTWKALVKVHFNDSLLIEQ